MLQALAQHLAQVWPAPRHLEAFLEHEAAPKAEELEQFARKHYPGGDHAEIRRRVVTFCDRIRDGKRRRGE